MLKNKKLLPKIIIIAVATIAVIIAAIFIVRATVKSNQFNKALQTANDYLTNLDYESAIASYKSAIEINPNNVEAYLGLADAYIGLEDYDSAISVLNDGLAVLPENAELTNKASEVQTLVDAKIAEEQKLAEYEEELAKETQEISDEAQENAESENANDDSTELNNEKWVLIAWHSGHSGDTPSIAFDYTYEYDENGNLIKEYFYGRLVSTYEYNGNMLLKKTSYSDNGEKVTGYHEYEYDEEGKLVQDIDYETSWTDYTQKEYNEKGQLVKETINETTITGYQSYWSYIYIYNDFGNLIEIQSSYNSYDYLFADTYEYSDDNILLRCIESNGQTRFACEHDECGNIIKEIDYAGDTPTNYYYEYEYKLIQINENTCNLDDFFIPNYLTHR